MTKPKKEPLLNFPSERIHSVCPKIRNLFSSTDTKNQIGQLKQGPLFLEHVLLQMVTTQASMSSVKAQVQLKDGAVIDPGLIIATIS